MYIVVCKYNSNNIWCVYNPNNEFNWIIDNDTVPDVLYRETNLFKCLRFKI